MTGLIEEVRKYVVERSEAYRETSEDHYDFWNEHIRYVYKEALGLAKKYGADETVVALGALLHASNLHCSSVSHTVIYMFQCYSLVLPHPLPLPQSPKVCSLHLCLLCCLAYRVAVTIFLDSIYMC